MNKVLELLAQATDTDLMLSRKNCHIQGLHSIVLRNDKGRLTRAFFTTPDHRMHENTLDGGLALGVHSHLYDITLKCISGKFCNHNYTKALEAGASLFHGFASTPDKKVLRAGLHPLRLTSFQWVYPNDKPIFMDSEDLHTVYVQEGERASWLVQEGPQVKLVSQLYCLTRDPVCTYERFSSADQVRAFVNNFYGV